MTIWAIIPVKQLHESKRRLEHVLSVEARATLIAQFLDHLLTVIDEAPDIDRVLLVTGDPAVIALAEEHEADILLERDPDGLNSAVAGGVARATESGAAVVLILPADLPFARVEDLEQMLSPLTSKRRPSLAGRPQNANGRPLFTITGDANEEGTNALLLAPPGDFTFHYGPGSFQAHLAEARARGREIHVINAPGLRFDLDTESDWLIYNGHLVGEGD